MRKGNNYDDLFPDMNALLGTVVIISSVLVGSNASKSHGDENSTASLCSLDRDGWMINERDTFKRDDPDAILNGFFPFWGALVLALSCKDLCVLIYSLAFDDVSRLFSGCCCSRSCWLFTRLSINIAATSSS